jgi:uncharacterized protein YndB with AHSA1/START domain
MANGLVAKVSSKVKAPVNQVWDALVTPEKIKEYMFGATVKSDWKVGSKITWSGEWKGAPYEDKGKILRLEPEHVLSYSHFSPLEGKPDKKENYHTVTIELSEQPTGTLVTLSQDNNASEDAREHSEQNWKVMLDGLKKVLEH